MHYLHTLVVHSPNLTYRKETLQNTLKIVEEISKKCSYKHHNYMILNHEPAELKPIFPELEKIIDYSKTGDDDFDKCLQQVTMEQVSNFLKQKEALQKIVQLKKEEKPGDEHLYLILEDDAMILPEFYNNLATFLQKPCKQDWDLLFLCCSLPDKNITNYHIVNIRSLIKILPSKEAYCIQPEIAERLLESLNKINYTYRFQLSYWIFMNKNIRAMCPSIRVSIEGSKLGFVPSSVCENNILIYNHEFMEMFKMMISGELDFQKAKQLYKVIEHLKCPEAMHIYGVILFKMDKKEQAKELFLDAVNQMLQKNGCINARSELLNNAINIHGIVQEDLEIFRKYSSKYQKITFD